MKKTHLRFMKEAVKEARKGLEEGGIPIGAVLVKFLWLFYPKYALIFLTAFL